MINVWDGIYISVLHFSEGLCIGYKHESVESERHIF
jgi:hypothetical protein